MKFHIATIKLKTEDDSFYDITNEAFKIVQNSKIQNGQMIIQPKHATLGIYLNENEELLQQDIKQALNTKVPKDKDYQHDNLEIRKNCPEDEPKNGGAHLRAALYSNPSLALIIKDGKLQLGKWQQILLAEFDGPCPRKNKSEREILISIMGE